MGHKIPTTIICLTHKSSGQADLTENHGDSAKLQSHISKEFTPYIYNKLDALPSRIFIEFDLF